MCKNNDRLATLYKNQRVSDNLADSSRVNCHKNRSAYKETVDKGAVNRGTVDKDTGNKLF